jgi:ribonuclease HI
MSIKPEIARAEKLARQKVAASPSAWTAWFDGSAHPNPGRIGIGALLQGPQGERIEISRRAGHGNSGDAEYLALIALLEMAVEMQLPELLVFGDSQIVVHDVLLAQGAGAKGLQEHRERVGALMAQLALVNVRWVPRHRNGEADRLSQQAISNREELVAGTACQPLG